MLIIVALGCEKDVEMILHDLKNLDKDQADRILGKIEEELADKVETFHFNYTIGHKGETKGP